MSAENRESMETILNPPAASEMETAETSERVETESEQVETKEEPGAAVTQVAAETRHEETLDAKGLKAAMIAERTKRQELEAQLAAEREAMRQASEEEKPFLGEEYEQRFAATEANLREEVIKSKIDISESFAREKYDDFDEKLAAFTDLARANPSLVQQMRASANPATFAYKAAAEHLQVQKLREIGDPVAYEAGLREKIKAELIAEQQAEKKAETEAAIRAKLGKGGFSEQRSVGNERTTTKTFNGPTPMTSILG